MKPLRKAAPAFIFFMAAALLVSCEQGRETAPASATEHPSTIAVIGEAADLPPYHLVMAFPSGTVPKDLPAVQEAMNTYVKKKINATVELRPIDWSVWYEETNLMFVSNEPFDLLFTSSWLYLGQEVAKKQIIPLDELLDRYGQGIQAALDPTYIESGKIKGRVYGILTNKEFASTKGIVMRKDLVDKYKIDLTSIKELEDLEPVWKMIKDNEPGIVPLQVKFDRSPLTTLLGYGQFDMLDSGGGPGVLDRSSKELKVVNLYETPAYRRYAELMHKWYKAGYINKDGSLTRQDEFHAVKAGKAFAYAESLKPGFAAHEYRNTGYPMVAVELTKPYTTTGDTTSAMFAISRNSKDPARAMMFLDLLYTDKYLLNLLNWGIENKHYVKVSETIIDYPPGLTATTVGYNLNLPWMFGNQLNSYIWRNEDPDIWEQYINFNNAADKSLALGFIFDPENVKNELAACNNVIRQYTGALNSGEFEPERILPAFNEALRAAGMDKVIREKQRQLDAWAASKLAQH
ncbi:ABC transporter substrate-binding protein [Paenibacillus chartarius]|uniref:ABC transporter substrate-binding protein n=1 Tax=Paenibacillus chartarius TaxID=747481 RepID=A0ABV6DJ98_9BACL